MVADAITYVDIGDAAVLKMTEGRLNRRPSTFYIFFRMYARTSLPFSLQESQPRIGLS
jgi:hypothetical protein